MKIFLLFYFFCLQIDKQRNYGFIEFVLVLFLFLSVLDDKNRQFCDNKKQKKNLYLLIELIVWLRIMSLSIENNQHWIILQNIIQKLTKNIDQFRYFFSYFIIIIIIMTVIQSKNNKTGSSIQLSKWTTISFHKIKSCRKFSICFYEHFHIVQVMIIYCWWWW